MGVPRKLTRADKLRETLDRAFPQRSLNVPRDFLIEAMAYRIERWKSIEPQIKPHAEGIAAAAAVAGPLYKALEKAARSLERLGVAEDIERAKAKARAFGIDSEHPPLAGQSAALDLYLTVWQAADRVRVWNRDYRRGRGNPGAFSTRLAQTLEELCRQRAGLSQYEFEDVLDAVSAIDGLPKLSAETLRKRKVRKRKQLGTK